MKVYIASKLENYRQVQAVRNALRNAGHVITYDWTEHGPAILRGIEFLKEVAENERDGVVSADAVVVLLPGGRGTHAELGMACALNIPVMLIADHPNTYFSCDENTCAFYWNSNVQHYVCYAEDLPDFVAGEIDRLLAGEATP